MQPHHRHACWPQKLGSHFYLASFWAQELAKQTKDAALQAVFQPVAEAMVANEAKIVEELNVVQGKPSEIDGYYRPSVAKLA